MLVLSPPIILTQNNPVIFLAGPIQGTDDWQSRAINLISQYNQSDEITVANPRHKWIEGRPLTNNEFAQQTDWEHNHLEQAGKRGCILFWLANENEHLCNRAYAQTSRYELAEAITLKSVHIYNNVVVGIDDSFPGSRYIERTINKRCPDITITKTLESTIDVAVRLIERKFFKDYNGF